MEKWLRRIRGAVGLGLTWAAAWSGVGAILGLVVGGGAATLVATSGALAVIGFVSGAAFSVVLGVAEGRRTFDEMSLPRFAAWGALSGLLVSLGLSLFMASPGGSVIVARVLVMLMVPALLGAGSAAGSLALARRADGRLRRRVHTRCLGLAFASLGIVIVYIVMLAPPLVGMDDANIGSWYARNLAEGLRVRLQPWR